MKPFARAAAAAAGLAALVAIVPAAAQANTAPHGRPTTAKVKKTYKVKARKHGKPKYPKVARLKAAGIKGCLPPLVVLDREVLCVVLPVTVTVVELEDGAPDGNEETYTFGVQLQISLSATSAKLDLDATAVGLSTSGDAPELVPSVTISSVCGHPCRTTTPQLLAIGTPDLAEGGASNEVTVHANQVVWPEPTITLFAELSGSKSNTISWPTGRLIRCDHLYPTAWRRPGCVFPFFIPTVDMSGLPHIAKNIRKVQGRGIHVGRPFGPHPLHRTTSQQEAQDNRRLVCPKHLHRPKGYQCDEYPFASAFEGGKRLPPIDRIIGFVPAKENQRQGQILKQFYANNRVFRGSPGDAYYVQA
jgi:hypothetical protein